MLNRFLLNLNLLSFSSSLQPFQRPNPGPMYTSSFHMTTLGFGLKNVVLSSQNTLFLSPRTIMSFIAIIGVTVRDKFWIQFTGFLEAALIYCTDLMSSSTSNIFCSIVLVKGLLDASDILFLQEILQAVFNISLIAYKRRW